LIGRYRKVYPIWTAEQYGKVLFGARAGWGRVQDKYKLTVRGKERLP
jgi:hypothetical protein